MLNILKKRGGVCSCFTRLALLWEEFMEGRRRETSTVEAILIFHCANIMPKSKPICVQQLHVAEDAEMDSRLVCGSGAVGSFGGCLWTVTSSFHASVSPYGHRVKWGW